MGPARARRFAACRSRSSATTPGGSTPRPARSFAHLRDLLRVHRFYIHTADPALEDGYNMATVEAMASGLPVLATAIPRRRSDMASTASCQTTRASSVTSPGALLADPAQAAALGGGGRGERPRRSSATPRSPARFDAAAGRSAAAAFDAWRASCSGARRSN